MILNENIESSHNKEEKNSLFTTWSPCSVCHPFCRSYQHYELFCSPRFTLVLLLLLFWGTYILIMFSCKLTNDEKLNTRSAQHNWETSAIKLPKKQFISAIPLPKKAFHPKTDHFLISNNFCCCCCCCFFQFRHLLFTI